MDFFPAKRRLLDIFTPQTDNSGTVNDPDPTTRGVSGGTPIFKSHPLNPNYVSPSDDEDNSSKLMELYNSPSPAVSRLNTYLASQPDRAEYEPSRKRRLGAALIGAVADFGRPGTGASAVRNINDKPFEDATIDWERQRQPLESAAKAEMADRVNKINALKDYLSQKRADTLAQSEMDLRKHTIQHDEETAGETARYHGLEHDDRSAAEQAREKAEVDAAKAREEAAKETHRHNTAEEAIANTNASTRATHEQNYQANIQGLNAYRKHLEDKVATGGPQAQKVAHDLAIVKVVQKPGNSQVYGDYYDQDSKGRIVLKPPTQGMFTSNEAYQSELLNYNKMQQEIAAEEANLTKGNQPRNIANVPKDNTAKPKARIVSREKGN